MLASPKVQLAVARGYKAGLKNSKKLQSVFLKSRNEFKIGPKPQIG